MPMNNGKNYLNRQAEITMPSEVAALCRSVPESCLVWGRRRQVMVLEFSAETGKIDNVRVYT